jgi:ferredoxin-NADP reductase/ferredoxin
MATRKLTDGPERISVTEVDALLYSPGHSSEQLHRVLQIPALSKGWQSSFQAMLQQDLSSNTTVGNPGLAYEEHAPAWPGFRRMRVANINKESDGVTSFVLSPIDGPPLPLHQAGQFVVLRLLVDPGKPPVLRSYSLSDLPAADHFRISVKSELNGIGSSFLCNHARKGDLLDVSAPRGSFTLRPSQGPVVLLSAGVGATPVMSMLHALAAERSQRVVWWIYGARNSIDHPFAEESRSLLKRPSRLRNWGVLAGNVHAEIFGSLEAITPGMAPVDHTPHLPRGPPGSGPPVSFARSGITTAWDPQFGSLLELAEACDVPVRWSCRIGVCHTCMTGLIDGSLTYNPEPLERPAPGNGLLCCSRPNAGVTLDL